MRGICRDLAAPSLDLPAGALSQVVGTLSGGTSSCDDITGQDGYARLAFAFDAGLGAALNEGATAPVRSFPGAWPAGGNSVKELHEPFGGDEDRGVTPLGGEIGNPFAGLILIAVGTIGLATVAWRYREPSNTDL